MKKLKLVISLLLAAVFTFALAACGKEKDPSAVRVVMPDGAPALALSALYEGGVAAEEEGVLTLTKKDTVKKGYSVTYSLTQESNLAASMASGKADIALMPTNAAAATFNKGADVKIVTVNVHGLLYLLGDAPLTDLNSLVGKVVYSIGEGGTPDYVFKYILDANGIAYEKSDVAVEGKVAITYVEGGSALIPLLKQGRAEYGILGEPAATNAVGKTGKVVALDLQQAWKAATLQQTGTALGLPQASLVISGKLIEEHPDFVNAFVAAVTDGDEWLKNNLDKAVEGMKALGSATANTTTFTPELLARCNLKPVSAAEIRAEIENYLTVLKNFKPQAIGGGLPGDAFYYG